MAHYVSQVLQVGLQLRQTSAPTPRQQLWERDLALDARQNVSFGAPSVMERVSAACKHGLLQDAATHSGHVGNSKSPASPDWQNTFCLWPVVLTLPARGTACSMASANSTESPLGT